MALEDFTTYNNDTDPNSRIAETTRRITATAIQRNEDAYTYLDKGAAFFDGDFVHNLTVRITDGTQDGRAYVWALTNTVDDMKGIDDASGSYLGVFLYQGPGPIYQIYSEESDSGTIQQRNYDISLNTTYYLSIERDESVGAQGTLYVYIFSDEARTTLLSTLTRALNTSKKDFQYIFAMNTWNSGTTQAISCYGENLELTGAILPIVTAQPLTDIASTAATGHGTIVDLGISAVTAHGYCWATTIDPTTADSKTDEGAGSLGVFTSSITGLSAGQEYYFRPYATNGAGTAYGANVYAIAGQPGTLRIKAEFAVVQTRWHYVGEDGKEYQLQGIEV